MEGAQQGLVLVGTFFIGYAYTCWDYNESITPSGSYWIKHEALETILTVWSPLTGFSWLSLLT